MDVIYSIGARLGGGGIGDTAFHAVRGIEKAGYLKKVIAISYDKDVLSEITRSKIETIHLPQYVSLGMWGIKKYLWRDFQGIYFSDILFDILAVRDLTSCDIFHGWNCHSLSSLKRANGFGAITIIERASSHPLYQYKLLMEEYSKFGIKNDPSPLLDRACKELDKCDYVTIPSDFVKQSFIEHKYPEEKLIQIPFGVDLSKFPEIKNKGRSNVKLIFLFAGIVGLRKGVQYLLQAWKELGLKDAELRICGNISPEFKKILEEYKNIDSIRVLGFVPDIKEELKKADVLVFPTIEEGSALVTYEAMAFGLPLITTTNSGSVARDGIDGFILPIRDIKALKKSIQYFYDNPGEIRKMGKNAREKIENYTWDKYGENLVKNFESLS